MTIREMQAQAMASVFVSAEQLALLLNCSEDSIKRLSARGELPALRVGRQLRFEREEALRIFRERQRAMVRKMEGP